MLQSTPLTTIDAVKNDCEKDNGEIDGHGQPVHAVFYHGSDAVCSSINFKRSNKDFRMNDFALKTILKARQGGVSG